MSLKTYKPTSSGQRHRVVVDRSHLWKGRPFKALTKCVPSTGGRNVYGRITSRGRGGRHKRLWREIDFKRVVNQDVPARVERLEYDPNRTAFIALIRYQDGSHAYILAPNGLRVGDVVCSFRDSKVEVKPGNAMTLRHIPEGVYVHNVELKPGKGGQVARSAGAYAQIVARDGDYVVLMLMSKEQRKVHASCMATVGVVSNADHANIVLGKAGRSRWRGIRPITRGIARNPVDHPHGGRTNGGRHPVTPWGKPTKGKKTRKNKSTDKYIVRSRHYKRKKD